MFNMVIFIEGEMHAWVVQVSLSLPAFFPDRFLSSMSKSSNSPWLLPQTANHYVPLHDTRVLDGLYLHTWHHQIKSWLLYSTYFAIVVGYALMSYVKACVLLVSQQFAKRLPKIFNMTLACCILLPLMVHILLCGWCWIPENATGTKWSDNMPCLHKPSHFQLSVISLVVVLSQSRDIASLYVQSKLKMKM